MFIIRWVFKLFSLFLMILGGYYLLITNFQPTDFFNDTRQVIENNIDFDFNDLKDQATEKITNIVEENKDSAKEITEDKIKNVVQDVIEKASQAGTADISGCRLGYYWDESSPTPCVQNDCEDFDFAEFDENGRCVCKNDEKHECFRSTKDQNCPGCLYACVSNEEVCPN